MMGSRSFRNLASCLATVFLLATWSCREERWIVSADATSGYCPVCKMKVSANGDWTSEIFYSDSTKIMFESPADLLTFYFSAERFQQEKRPEITQVRFKEYGSKKPLDATVAALVIESRIKGPMGPDVFAFENSTDAEAFVASNGGVVTQLSGITRESVQNLRP